jgi:hypothetical protein
MTYEGLVIVYEWVMSSVGKHNCGPYISPWLLLFCLPGGLQKLFDLIT